MKDTLLTALNMSGKLLLEYFNKQIEAKRKESQSSVVTEADLKSDSVIVSLIENKFPDHNIISEEGGFRNKSSKYTWVIDPLDGTSNFAAKIPWFGILICLFEGEEPVMGGAYLPVFDILYFAERGKGSFRNGIPITLKQSKGLTDSLIAFSVDYTDDEIFLNKGIDLYKFIIKNSRNIRSTNSLFDFIYVAEGKFGGCINLYTKIWDISALGLIISEAGGIMNDISGNKIKFVFNKDIVNVNYPVVAGSSQVYESLREFLIHTFISQE